MLVDPCLNRPLPNTYGLWVDEVDLPRQCYARIWSRPLVFSDAGGARELQRAYGHLDNRRVVQWLRGRLERAGGTAVEDRVVGLTVTEAGGTAELDRSQVRADVVFDCTGSARRFLETDPASCATPSRGFLSSSRSVAWQTAHGIVAEVDHVPWDHDQMVLMDFRSLSGEPDEVPSFLYALPLGGGKVLLEETVLAAVPAVSREVLTHRLDQRLDRLGMSVRRIYDVEDVRIPMDAPLPRRPQPVVGFGAAAGFVHPATGYSVARSLNLAPQVAAAVAMGLAQGGPKRASAAAWRIVQSTSQRRAYRLARSGLQALLSLGPHAMGQFMHHFFSMPQARWAAFLSGTSSASALAGSMFLLGAYLPVGLVLRVSHQVARKGVVDFVYGLIPGLETDVRCTS